MSNDYKILTEGIVAHLKESEEERQAFIKSLQLAPGEHDLTDKELKDFASRSRHHGSTPAYQSALADLSAMGENRLKQVIAHPRVHVFAKHHARKRLAGEWK
jgi:hypothetical protein